MEGLEEAVASVGVTQVADAPGEGTAGQESDAPRPEMQTRGREHEAERTGGFMRGADLVRGDQGGDERGLAGRGAGDRVTVGETGVQGANARNRQRALGAEVGARRGGVIAHAAANVRERTARIRAELAEILESQGGALVFDEGPGAGLRIGVRTGGFVTARVAEHPNPGAGFVGSEGRGQGAPSLGFGNARSDVGEPGRGRGSGGAQRGAGRGFAGRGRARGVANPRVRAARVIAELGVILAGSTPPGIRNPHSTRHLLETTLEDYGFTVERGKVTAPRLHFE